MKVLRAARSGFCPGVRRAMQLAWRSLEDGARPVQCLGPLIHNRLVLEDLYRAGMREVESVGDARSGTLIVRSHGARPAVFDEARRRGLTVVDATCPFVRRAQETARNLSLAGLYVVIVGDRDHPEVQGIAGWVPGRGVVVRDAGEAERLGPALPGEAGLVAQTTQSRANFEAVASVLTAAGWRLRTVDTICHATRERQEFARSLARQVPMMVVVGGTDSANTGRLAAICREAGATAHLVEKAADLDPEWFVGVEKAGLTAGASTPDWIIEEVEGRMSEFDTVTGAKVEEELQTGEVRAEEVTAAEVKAEEVAGGEAEAEEVAGAEVEAEETAGGGAEAEEVAAAEVEAEEVAGGEAEAEEVAGGEVKAEEVAGGEVKAEEAGTEEAGTEPEEAMAQVDFKALRHGEITRGVVVAVSQDEVFVDVHAKSEGVIPLRELSCYDISSPQDVVKVGDEIDVYVMKTEDNEGRVVLSKEKADAEKAWMHLEDVLQSAEAVPGRVREVVKGGLLVDVGVRAFLPASLVERGYVDDLSKYLGADISARVIELNRARKKVILSRKAVLETEYARQRQELLEKLAEGGVVRGVVRRLTQFGAFVDIGGIDGLLHISEMAWHRVGHPSEVVKVGDELDVMVLKVDRTAEKVSLGLKQVLPNPWDNVAEKYVVGTVVPAKVVRLASFGAFVQLEPGVEGLVHISHLADRHVARPEDVVSEGETVQVKVLSVDQAEKRIRLSVREVEPSERPAAAAVEDAKTSEHGDGAVVTLGDVFGSMFQTDEEESGDPEN